MAKIKTINGKWTPEEHAILVARLKQPGSVSEVCRDVSLATGRSEKGVSCRIHSDCLTADRPRPMPDGVPLEMGEGDYRYVERLMDLGGFASSTRIAGKIVFGHAGKAWVQP